MNEWIAAERMQAKEKRAFFRNVLSHHTSQSSRRLTSPLASFLFFLSLPSVFSVPGAVQCHRSRGLRPTAFSGTIFKYDVASFVFDVKPNASPKLPLLKNIEGVVPEALLGVRLRDRGVKPDALFGDFLAEEVAFDLGAGLVFGNLSIFQLLRKSGRTWKAKAAHLLCTWRL